jgi:hypothetical protein
MKMPISFELVRSRGALFGPDLVKDAEEKVEVIRENLKLAQIRQKNYHDKGTSPRHYEVGDYVYLKVSPTKGVQQFGVKGKLAPRYFVPYEIIEVCGPVAYCIRLPDQFSVVQNVFHVTQLKKGVKVPTTEVITEENAWIEPDFLVVEHPLRVLDQTEGKTKRHTVKMYKIQWSHHTDEESTWETEYFLNTKHPGFLQSRNSKNLTPTFVFNFRISGRDSF